MMRTHVVRRQPNVSKEHTAFIFMPNCTPSKKPAEAQFAAWRLGTIFDLSLLCNITGWTGTVPEVLIKFAVSTQVETDNFKLDQDSSHYRNLNQ
jgi:hypothetical protein